MSRSGGDSGSLQPRPDLACRRARAGQGRALRVAVASLDRHCAPRPSRRVGRGEATGFSSRTMKLRGRKKAAGRAIATFTRVVSYKDGGRKRARTQGADAQSNRKRRSERRMPGKQVELPRVVVTPGRDGLVVTAYLGKVGRLEWQGEVHQHLRNIGGGFVERGVFGRWIGGLGRPERTFPRLRGDKHRERQALTLAVASDLRVDLILHEEAFAFDDDGVGWGSRTRSRMAEVKVLSLLKICDQCL